MAGPCGRTDCVYVRRGGAGAVFTCCRGSGIPCATGVKGDLGVAGGFMIFPRQRTQLPEESAVTEELEIVLVAAPLRP